MKNKGYICNMEEERKTNRRLMLSELGKYCIDISKLVFGGVILAGIMKLEINRTLLFGLGAIIVLIMLITGLGCTLLSNTKKE